MAIHLPADADDDTGLVATINTTPLVDVMLVLLIIFMITVPVVVHSVTVALPREVDQPTRVKPDTIIVAVDRNGGIYWNDAPVADADALLTQLERWAVETPQPEVQIRGDREARYEFVGRVVAACQRAGIAKVAFITEPEPGSAGR